MEPSSGLSPLAFAAPISIGQELYGFSASSTSSAQAPRVQKAAYQLPTRLQRLAARESDQQQTSRGASVKAALTVSAIAVASSGWRARNLRRHRSKKVQVRTAFDEDVYGSVCTLWHEDSRKLKIDGIDEEILSTPWAGLIDKASSGDAAVRACRKNAKQVATLGPVSSTREAVERLFLCGVDMFRLNFSHGEHSEKTELIKIIREVEARYVHPIAIMADMQGPKQRCGKFEDPNGVELVAGQRFRFDLDPKLGDNRRAQLPHPEILMALEPGKSLLLDDGKIQMKVIDVGCTWEGKDIILNNHEARPSSDVSKCPPFIDCEVTVAGHLGARKGVNTPDVILKMSPITPKDAEDIKFACKSNVDWIAMSFIQRHEDMEELRRLVEKAGGAIPKLLAKIEKPSAVDDLDNILLVSDGIMVARGDLGVEMSPEKVPFVQKEMIMKAQSRGRPVIVATQMLESMISNPMPTRAECSDVANAIIDGCDAVMLSGESAVGKYPTECVAMQRRVIEAAEANLKASRFQIPGFAVRPSQYPNLKDEETMLSFAQVRSAASLAEDIGAKAIVVYTATGRSAQLLVHLRPAVPIIAVCPCLETARWLSLFRGVYATSDAAVQALAGRAISSDVSVRSEIRFNEAMEIACRLASERGLVQSEADRIVVALRLPLFRQGPLNTVRWCKVSGPAEEDKFEE